MARRDDPKSRHLRGRVAQEAARLLAETGGDDLVWARRKAAARFGLRDESALPGGDEILAALREHRALFGAPAPDEGPRARAEAALEAMRHFADLEPRLVGSPDPADGPPGAAVQLHLHADDPDAVARLLLERGVPARQATRRVRLTREAATEVPAWTFDAGGIAFELLQLPLGALRQSPRDPLDDRPLERTTPAALRRWLDGERMS